MTHHQLSERPIESTLESLMERFHSIGSYLNIYHKTLDPKLRLHAKEKMDAETAALESDISSMLSVISSLAADRERLEWLEVHCTETPLNPRSFNSEFAPDTRLIYALPKLISTTCVGGSVSLRDAIDYAMKEKT